MSEYSRALRDTMRAARKKFGLSQSQVANLIDADERTVMNIETYRANTTMMLLVMKFSLTATDERIRIIVPIQTG